eukprot:PhF_6_TR31397/c0_g1_i3/m.45994
MCASWYHARISLLCFLTVALGVEVFRGKHLKLSLGGGKPTPITSASLFRILPLPLEPVCVNASLKARKTPTFNNETDPLLCETYTGGGDTYATTNAKESCAPFRTSKDAFWYVPSTSTSSMSTDHITSTAQFIEPHCYRKKQTIHPIATVEIVSRKKRYVLWSLPSTRPQYAIPRFYWVLQN